MTKGYCINTISDKEYVVDDTHPYSFSGDPKDALTWWAMRPYFVYLPFQSWEALKKYLIEQCKSQNCDAYVASWERKVNHLDDKIGN